MDPINILGTLFAIIAGVGLLASIVALILDGIQALKRRRRDYRKEHEAEILERREKRKTKLKEIGGIAFLVVFGLCLLYVLITSPRDSRSHYDDEDFIERFEHRPDRY